MPRYTEFDYGVTALSSRFHQDWSHEGTARDVLRHQIRAGHDDRAVEILRRDAVALAERLPNQHVETLWTAATGGNFAFPRTAESGTAWMRLVADECADWLSEHPAPELEDADTDPGSAHLADVLAIVEALPRYGVRDDVTASLALCARTCSPELAVRFLVLVLAACNTDIDRDLYDRMAAVGDRMGFGEFLVPTIAYLVV